MKVSMEVSQKFKHEIILWCNNPNIEYISTNIEMRVLKDTFLFKLILALFAIAKYKRKLSGHQKKNEWKEHNRVNLERVNKIMSLQQHGWN